MNEKINNSTSKSFGYEESRSPPAIVPIQETPRQLPALPNLDEKTKEILDETIGFSTRLSTQDLRFDLSSTRYSDGASDRPFILSSQTISSINNTLSRH